MTIRFAILAGVSTDAQARDEKQSIPDQIKTCRNKIQQHGGIETAGPFVMDGYSRTGYDSLDVAMNEIPPLGEAIRAAQTDQYDILIMDNYDRLGDLGVIVKTRFKKLRKQLHSTRQSGLIIHPEAYDPYASEEADIAMYVEGIIQSYRINKIRRGYNLGVPKRAQAGLHSLSISYGYKKTTENQPAEQVPEEVSLILKIKDWFLSGLSLQSICDEANASGIKPRRGADEWHRSSVRRILANPYYAGITIFGRYKKQAGQRIAQPQSQWTKGQGRHKPLWDENTYYAILAEFERRNAKRTRSQIYALSGVLECSVCGSRLDRHGKKEHMYYYCRGPQNHIKALRVETALKIVAAAVVNELQSLQLNPPPAQTTADAAQKEITRQMTQRRKIQDGYEKGIYTETEAKNKIVAIETEIERLTHNSQRSLQAQQQKQIMLAFAQQDLSRLHDWIINDDPATVNHFLSSLCQKIIITPAHIPHVNFRI